MIEVAPSLLAADFLHLEEQIDKVIDSGADYLHYDVMDGSFVPAISFGAGILKQLSKKSIAMDVHLMVVNPEKHIRDFAEAGARLITFHAEAASDIRRVIELIHECGCLAGVSVKPDTPVACLDDVIEDLDLVLVMTVEPGKGGQKLIPETIQKVAAVRDLCVSHGVFKRIEVDGGINAGNVSLLTQKGANVIVAGSAFFRETNAREFVAALKSSPEA